jgi:hypothetical protein
LERLPAKARPAFDAVDTGSPQGNAAQQNNPFEPARSGPRPSAAAMTRRQTLGRTRMKSFRPNNSDPIPLRRPPHNIGTIMIRFVGLWQPWWLWR